MRKGFLLLPGLVVLLAIALLLAANFTTTFTSMAKSPTSHRVHILRQRGSSQPGANISGVAAANANTTASANVPYQGGPVMAGTANVYAIFWEPTGNVSANYNSLIERYFGDVGGSALYQNMKQYTQAGGTFPSNAVLAASWVDTSAYPETPLLDSDIQNEVTRAQNANSWTSGVDNIFFVFTEKNEGICLNTPVPQISCTPDVSSSTNTNPFCAYHSYFGTNNTLYAALPYAASPSFKSRCMTGAPGIAGTGSSPNNDEADQTINLASHEQMEAATDPLLNAWVTPSSDEPEIGDLCAWKFGPNDSQAGDVVWGSHNYIVQQEWDNAISGCTLSGNHSSRYYRIVNHNSNLVMDVYNKGLNAGAQVIQWGNNNGANQQWDLVPDGAYYQIVNRNSGLVLDVFNGGQNPGANVIQWVNHNGFNQQWYLVPDGAYDQIVNRNDNLVLDVYNGGLNAGAHVIQWGDHNGLNQQWGFAPINPYYQIVNRNSNLAMDVFNGGINPGANVIQWPFHGGLNQQWALTPDGLNNGIQVYQIVNLHSGLVMDVYGGGKTQGANVVQWGNHNGLNQQWELVQDGNYYQIVNVNSQLVLGVFNGGKTQGVNVIQWINNQGLNQQWSLIPTSA